ncbi:sodium:proton antiporter [soil metagenome]
MSEHVLIGLSSILVLGISAQWLAWRLRIPAILLLLLAGCIAGAGTEWLSTHAGWPAHRFLDPNKLFGELLLPLVSLSVALILFEGGLTLTLSELSVAGNVIGRLVSIGAIVTWALSALAVRFIAGMDWPLSILMGAILVVTGPTVIGPLLRHVRPTGKVGPIIKWEGIVIDPIGAMLAVLAFEAIPLHGSLSLTAMVLLRSIVMTIAVSMLLGIGGATLLVVVLHRRWVPDYLQTPVTLGIVIAVFTACNAVQPESGLFATTLMGVILANQRFASVHHIAEFKETLTVLLVSALFIIVGSRLRLDQLASMSWRHVVLVLALVIIVRPVSVFLSTLGAKVDWRERLFIASMAPRGVVAAAVTSVFAIRLSASGYPNWNLMVPMIFAVVLGTVAVYGLAAAPLARALGLAKPEALGFLIVGADPASRQIALTLQAEGMEVLMVDTNRQNVVDSRMQGLPVHFGSANSAQLVTRIELSGIGRLLALTANDEVNALASMHFSRIFGRSEVYQLAPANIEGTREEKVAHALLGHVLFNKELTHRELARRIANGATIKNTKLTAEFTLAQFRQGLGASDVPLFLLDPGGALRVITATDDLTAKSGQSIIYLAAPRAA